MRQFTPLFFFLIFTSPVIAQQVNIIPNPVVVTMGKRNFLINKKTVISYNEETKYSADYLKNYLSEFYGLHLTMTKNSPVSNNCITLKKDSKQKKDGYYDLKCNANGIVISGTNKGVFYGIQTLIQLLPVQNTTLTVPALAITDYPLFDYRGMHLDAGRHFFPISFIKKYIDYLAYHKLNIFHWHLTEDQGWRIEIKKYPRLTEVGAWRNGTIIGRYPGKGNDNTFYGGFYTQAEIKEVVQYAKERYIDVIPEIELPGHSSAAIAAYPWLSCFPAKPTFIRENMISNKSVEEQKAGRIKLVQETWGVFDDVFCAGNDSTFNFLEDVLDEVIKLFPSKYIHIGGDECPKTHWKICPKCQQRMKSLGLKDEHELQSYFIQRIEKYLNKKGKSIIGWDEILEGGLAPNATVMSWRGEQGGIDAAKQHHNVIMTPGDPLYFDHTQSENEDSITIGGYNPIDSVYAYNPVPGELKKEEEKFILGAQANVWTEYMSNEKKVEYMIFPRMAALSEILWSPKNKKDGKDFEKRIPEQMKRYELWKANYSKAFYDLSARVEPSPLGDGLSWFIISKSLKELKVTNEKGEIIQVFGIDRGEPVVGFDESTKLTAEIKDENNITHSVTQEFKFNKATGKVITLTSEAAKNYPGDGAFTLINGVQNVKGMSRGKEFLGWSGDDCEAIIDLGGSESIRNVVVHSISAGGSRVLPPLFAEVFTSQDGKTFTSAGKSNQFKTSSASNGVFDISFSTVTARFVKVLVKNVGIIPEGKTGAGNKAWLFVDEIEIN